MKLLKNHFKILSITCVFLSILGLILFTKAIINFNHKSALPIYHMDADHSTFSSATDLQNSSDLIVIGTVMSQKTTINNTAATDSMGNPIPALPHTDYSIHIEHSLKGGFGSNNGNIIISLTGGTTQQGVFVLDNGTLLVKSDSISPKLTIKIMSASIDFRKSPLSDRAHFTGKFILPKDVSFSCGDEVIFALNEPLVSDTLIRKNFKHEGSVCRYTHQGNDKKPIETLILDLKKQTFDLKLRKDSSINSISNPITFLLQLGVSQGSQQITMQKHFDDWSFRSN